MQKTPSDELPTAYWIVDLVVTAVVTLAEGESLTRDDFFDWLWQESGEGELVGIDEGAVTVADAVALGLVVSDVVIDAAAAPADRDWVASLKAATVACWCVSEAAARALSTRLASASGCRVVGIRPDMSGDSGDDWKSGFGPIAVPGFGVIRPAWEEGIARTSDASTTVFIDPGVGFGTGEHETTQLCLASLAAWQREGGSIGHVLDFGSGSGILGIAAAVSGAERVDAIEIDLRVHDTIRSNARRNDATRCVSVAAHVPAVEHPYDLIFANIVAAVLLEQADMLCSRLRRGAGDGAGLEKKSCLILSGLLAGDLPEVLECYARVVGALPVHTSLGEWQCLRFTVADSRHGSQSASGGVICPARTQPQSW
ncbi:MAG: 50S ribosomal protein L11 methyltransferase [Planctomycetota bacterium]